MEVEKHSPKKKKEEDPLQKVVEKKKYNAALYNQYLVRGGARNPGCKEIPEVFIKRKTMCKSILKIKLLKFVIFFRVHIIVWLDCDFY